MSIPPDNQRVTGREEPLRSQGGRYATRWNGLPRDSQRGGPALAAGRCLGHQRASVPVSGRTKDERSVPYAYLTVATEHFQFGGSSGLGLLAKLGADVGAGTNSY